MCESHENYDMLTTVNLRIIFYYRIFIRTERQKYYLPFPQNGGNGSLIAAHQKFNVTNPSMSLATRLQSCDDHWQQGKMPEGLRGYTRMYDFIESHNGALAYGNEVFSNSSL